MTRKSLLALFIVIAGIGYISAKDPFTKNELPNGLTKKATLKLADRYYAESSYYSSAENYRQYLKKKPDDRYATYWLGMASYYARDYEGAEDAFRAFYELKPGKKDNAKKWDKQTLEYFKEGRLYYGMALHRNGKYEEAKPQLAKFRVEYYAINREDVDRMIKIAKLEEEGCDSSAHFGKQKVKVKPIQGEGINTPYAQAAPFLYDDNTLYYSGPDGGSVVNYTETKNKKYTYIYKAKKEGKYWNKGTKLAPVINEDKYFTGNGTFNPDRTRFYFTKCLEMDDDRAVCNIFVIDVKNGNFQGEPRRLPEGINFESKFTSTHPAVRKIDAEREVLFYATDREGGKGGLDIWFTQRTKEGEYLAPKPFTAINTVGDEVTPFFEDSTKTLYFSSNGLPGMGGFDVFYSHYDEENKTWAEPRNMGPPINGGADDLYYIRATDQTYGYMVSNRQGSVPLAGIMTASDDIFYWENLHFAIDGELARKGRPNEDMSDARFNLYAKQPDGSLQLIGVDSTSKSGKYFFNLSPDKDYMVEAVKPGFLPQIDSITTKGLDKEDTLTDNMKVAKDGFIVYGKIKEDSLPHAAIMNAAVLIYELKNGQETLLREMTAADSFYYTYLPIDKDFKILARKEGYFAANVHLSTKGLAPGLDSLRADISLRKVIVNKEYKLSNILYEFDKATLTATSKKVLDTLYDILKDNPTFEIELYSHTDGKGADAYNLKLSQARAESCVSYLVKKGINKKRMVPIGFGMRKPIAPNTNPDGSDNPDGRALNRRTEFKITKI